MAITANAIKKAISQQNPAQTAIDNLLNSFINTKGEPVLFKIQGENVAKIDANAFVLHIVDVERITLEKEFTDHLIEDGSYIGNHTITKPIIIKIDGYITNIFKRLSATQKLAQTVSEKLTIIAQYSPKIGGEALKLYNKINNTIQGAIDFIDSAIQDGKNLLDFLNIGGQPESEVDQKLKILKSIFNANQPLVCYPCGIEVDNMYIQKLEINRDPIKQNGRVNLSIEFKQVKFSTILKSTRNFNKQSLRRQAQSSKSKNQGVVTPKQTSYKDTNLSSAAQKLLNRKL